MKKSAEIKQFSVPKSLQDSIDDCAFQLKIQNDYKAKKKADEESSRQMQNRIIDVFQDARDKYKTPNVIIPIEVLSSLLKIKKDRNSRMLLHDALEELCDKHWIYRNGSGWSFGKAPVFER